MALSCGLCAFGCKSRGNTVANAAAAPDDDDYPSGKFIRHDSFPFKISSSRFGSVGGEHRVVPKFFLVMRTLIALTLSVIVTVIGPAAIAQNETAPAPSRLTDAKREELRKKAEALSERNAREREEIQKGFRPENASDTVPGRRAPVNQSQICRATIAALMGRDPQIIKVDSDSGGITSLSYRRASDGSYWSHRCKVMGQTVIWATKEGRWRDHPLDEKVSFEQKGENLIIRQRHFDGSTNENLFPIAAL